MSPICRAAVSPSRSPANAHSPTKARNRGSAGLEDAADDLRRRDRHGRLAPAQPRQPDLSGRVDRDHPVAHGRPEHRAHVDEPGLDRARRERTLPRGGGHRHRLHPRLDMAGTDQAQVDLGERRGPGGQRHRLPRVVGPQLVGSPRLEVGQERHLAGLGVDPASAVQRVELLAPPPHRVDLPVEGPLVLATRLGVAVASPPGVATTADSLRHRASRTAERWKPCQSSPKPTTVAPPADGGRG